jgi:hypothetical protein
MNEYQNFYQQKLENEKKLFRKEQQLYGEIDRLSLGGDLSSALSMLVPLNSKEKSSKRKSISNNDEGNILEQSIDLFQSIQHTVLLIRKFFRQFSTSESK